MWPFYSGFNFEDAACVSIICHLARWCVQVQPVDLLRLEICRALPLRWPLVWGYTSFELLQWKRQCRMWIMEVRHKLFCLFLLAARTCCESQRITDKRRPSQVSCIYMARNYWFVTALQSVQRMKASSLVWGFSIWTATGCKSIYMTTLCENAFCLTAHFVLIVTLIKFGIFLHLRSSSFYASVAFSLSVKLFTFLSDGLII